MTTWGGIPLERAKQMKVRRPAWVPIIVLREKDSCEPKSDFNRYYFEKYDKAALLTYERAIEKHILACLKKDFHFDSII